MDSLDLGVSRLWSQDRSAILVVPPEAAGVLSPATHCLYEWTDYWLECPGADRLRIGTKWQGPIARGLFSVRFENELGLTVVQPFAGSEPVDAPLHVEVISRKFPDLTAHVTFFRSLIDDLFARAARLPFAIAAPTGRAVTETMRPPTPIFTLHFLSQYGPALRTALAIVQASPHRRLRDQPAEVRLGEADEVDVDVLIGILRTPHGWVPARGFPLAEKLGGYSPARVWQRLPEETYDTPENRFVLAALREMLTAAEALPIQRWWNNVPAERRAAVREVGSLLQRTISHPIFATVSPMHHFPASSRVLQRREGYRDMLLLWQAFQRARRPLFAPLRHAIDVRDIALLYEMWAFFALIEEIAVVVGRTPVIDLRGSDVSGLGWEAEARFGDAGKLIYNRLRRSYSRIAMRPDFTWVPRHGPEVALDAKFRLDRTELEPDDAAAAESNVKHDDLYRMHAYRDGLGVRAAIVVYPGDGPVYHHHRSEQLAVTLRDVLLGDWSAVDAIPLRPGHETGES